MLPLLALFACGEGPLEPGEAVLLPSENYHYTDVQLEEMAYQEEVYVPVYSDIYHLNGERRFLLTITLSIRNILQDQSVYIGRVDYFDSDGKLIRSYLEKTIELKPLQSVEFVVERDEQAGKTGPNFIVSWGGASALNPPVIQAVMIGTSSQQGISFVTNGVRIQQEPQSQTVFTDTTAQGL